MNFFKNIYLLKKKSENNKDFSHEIVDQYIEIAKLVKEARIQQNLSIEELSHISKIPEQTINSIENNNKNIRPKYPFIRSILIKLEECLGLKKNVLVKSAIRERRTFKNERKDFLVSKKGSEVRKSLLLSLIKDDKLELTDAKKLIGLIRDTFSPLNIAKSAVQNIISTV